MWERLLAFGIGARRQTNKGCWVLQLSLRMTRLRIDPVARLQYKRLSRDFESVKEGTDGNKIEMKKVQWGRENKNTDTRAENLKDKEKHRMKIEKVAQRLAQVLKRITNSKVK